MVIIQFGFGISMAIRSARNPGQYLYTIKHALEFLKEFFFSTAVMSAIPLDPYHSCFPVIESIWTIVQVCMSLGFGKQIITLSKYPSNSLN